MKITVLRFGDALLSDDFFSLYLIYVSLYTDTNKGTHCNVLKSLQRSIVLKRRKRKKNRQIANKAQRIQMLSSLRVWAKLHAYLIGRLSAK